MSNYGTDIYNTPRIKRQCLICKKTYMANFYSIKRGTGRHCSRSCANAGRAGKPQSPRFRYPAL